MVFGVELDDAAPDIVGTLFEDTVNNRMFCGEGCFDLTGLVELLRDLGFDGPWGVEILSNVLPRIAGGPSPQARRGVDAGGALAAAAIGTLQHRDTGGFGQPVRQLQHASGFLSGRTFRRCSAYMPGESLRLQSQGVQLRAFSCLR